MKEIKNKFNFKDKDVSLVKSPVGLSEETVRFISKMKNEEKFFLDFRLKALKEFFAKKNPSFGPDLSFIDFQDYTYYTKVSEGVTSSWEEVPSTIKETFDKIGIPKAEQEFLAGITTQYESEAVYSNMLKEVEEKGVIFLDTDTGIRLYPEIFKKYFGKLVPPSDNKYAALNSAVFSGGSFIYVPKGVKLEKPLQSYFRINNKRSGQFERSLIIVDDGAELSYVEGCTAPMYSVESLHAAVVEIFVGKNAKMRYTTIQNWSTSILNLVTQRATVDENGLMEWVDGNVGSKICMKYPCCILKGDGAKGSTISMAFSSSNQYQDTGAKMIHLGKNTSSTIISKSISQKGGTSNFRGEINISPKATNSKAHCECDTLILDNKSFSDTIPNNTCNNSSSYLEHEASVSKINEEYLYYLTSRGLSFSQAREMLVLGFLEPLSKELPMEYAVELNQLLKLDMEKEGSIG